MDERIPSYGNAKHVELDFEEVEVGVTKIKSIKIINHSTELQTYIVQRNSMSNPLDCVFDTVAYTWSLEPCESYVCDISYKPNLPNRKYTDYFLISDTFKCCYRIVVRGFSLGPRVTCSATKIIMSCSSAHRKAQKCFKLTNLSGVGAKFMFDNDAVQCPFKISETSGEIKASSAKCFNVAFEPCGIGIYKYRLTCLILNQDPIIIELYGLCSSVSDRKQIQAFHSRIQDIGEPDVGNTFFKYMSDVTTAVKSDPPLVTLSYTFVDFGQTEIGPGSFGKCTPQTVSLTNHATADVYILWEKDVKGVFNIRPLEATARPDQSIIFEISFDPCEERAFYSTELMARVFQLPCCATHLKTSEDLLMNVIPEFVSVRLIGHTYNFGFNDWMPQYEIPEAVIMPPCVPASPVYTTFAIRNFGHQPLMFSFVPPAVSHYNVKPMMGLITPAEEQQVVAVQLFPEAEDGRGYVERWAIRLNGEPRNEVHVDLHGYAEQARVFFAAAADGSCSTALYQQQVDLKPVHLGCRGSHLLPVRNATRHSLRFEYLTDNFPKELDIEPMSGIIHPNETVCHDWILTPDQLQNYEFNIYCRLSTEISSRSSVTEIKVLGRGMEGSLFTIEEQLDFGERVYSETCEKELQIYNFTPVTIHFLLVCRPTKSFEVMKKCENDIKISPIQDSISPGKSSKVQVIFTPTQPGLYELTIEYLTRASATEDDPLPFIKAKTLCTLNSMCILPSLQVKDLIYLAETNKQVSKVSLWRSLRIDELNAAAENLLPFYEASIDMIVPFVTLNDDEKFTVWLLLENQNAHEATWSLNKSRSCLCNDQRTKKFTVKKSPAGICLYCVHDQSILIHPKNITLKAKKKSILTIEVKSNTLLPVGIYWDLNIGAERHVTLNVKLESSILWSGPVLSFKDIYIGQCNYMHHQVIWLNNDSECENLYEIETRNITLTNRRNHGVILTCLNPEGTIKPYTRKPVIFGFSPNRIGTINASVSVKLGERESLLSIKAESICIQKKIDVGSETCPLSDTFETPENMVIFNRDCVIAPPIPTHGKMTHVVMMHNHHLQNVMFYKWKNYEIEGIVKVTAHPLKGLIQPNSLISIMIETRVYKYQISLDVDLFCEFVDVSERRYAEKRRYEHEMEVKKLEKEFTITEKGTSYPKIPALEGIKKPTTFCKTLTMRIKVYHAEDADQSVDLPHALKITPDGECSLETERHGRHDSPKILEKSSLILECMIWDIINSNQFADLLRNTLTTPHDLKYSQLPATAFDRINHSKRSNCTVPKRYAREIFHEMINMITHEEFNLTTEHFAHLPDVRQSSYQKVHLEISNELIDNNDCPSQH